MRKNLLFIVIALYLFINCLQAKSSYTIDREDTIKMAPIYAVFFVDKANSPYSVERPLEFLSQRALDRRDLRGIAVNEDDLPVNPNYVDSINSTGAYVKWTSRWGNFAIVHAYDEMLDNIALLSCVDSIVYIRPSANDLDSSINDKWENINYSLDYDKKTNGNTLYNYNYGYNYGVTEQQIAQINGIAVHEAGYDGTGIIIAVLDAGFTSVDVIYAFDSLRVTDRILLAQDIVEKGGNVYLKGTSSHGTAVLSLMGAYLKDTYVGTAPGASYALIRTEDAHSEYLVEEYYWMIGAEIADSIGADILNSSLGYSTFDDLNMDHLYSEMDGNTAISSIAVKRLAERGIMSVISAGNSFTTEWPWVGTPADAVEALTIGAVDLDGDIAFFSSCGPNGAGDPKPNTCACGVEDYVIGTNNQIYNGSGTSFSSPLTCGIVACLVQAAPSCKVEDLKNIIESTADKYPEHSDRYGYGIPDFGLALSLLSDGILSNVFPNTAYVYPNPANDKVHVVNNSLIINRVIVYDITGRMLNDVFVYDNETIIDVHSFNSNLLLFRIEMSDGTFQNVKVIK